MKLTPLTTRPSFTSRQGMTRIFNMAQRQFRTSCGGGRRASPKTLSWLQPSRAQRARDRPEATNKNTKWRSKIVEGLTVVLAADHARNDPIEVHLTAQAEFRDLLASDGDKRRTERDEQETSRMMKTVRARIALA